MAALHQNPHTARRRTSMMHTMRVSRVGCKWFVAASMLWTLFVAAGATELPSSGKTTGVTVSLPASLPASVGANVTRSDELLVYVGTYTQGKSEGIYSYRMDLATGKLSPGGVTKGIRNPSFLAIHPSRRFLYAVS